MPMPRKPEPEKYCLHCGIKFQRKYYGAVLEDLTVFKRRKYCSLICAGAGNAKRGSVSEDAYHFRAKKFRGSKCEACGIGKTLVAHHIDQNIENNVTENIQTLCKKCHDFWHSLAKKTKRKIAGKMPCLYP